MSSFPEQSYYEFLPHVHVNSTYTCTFPCTVSINALWYKLVECDVSCKIIPMIKSMYQNVKSCVKFGM